MSARTRPSLRREKSYLREGAALIAGCDEVGRGALAGPVSVGVVVVNSSVRRVPQGLTDSKLLTAVRREALVPKIQRWAHAHAVGHATPEEIDAYGMTYCLRLAGLRALAALPVVPDLVLLDGNFDWITYRARRDVAMMEAETAQEALWDAALFETRPEPRWPQVPVPSVVTHIKADLACASVAAASVLAKTTRDAIMCSLADDFPEYGWRDNKGYASDAHWEELRRSGPCEHHRRSWRPFTQPIDKAVEVSS